MAFANPMRSIKLQTLYLGDSVLTDSFIKSIVRRLDTIDHATNNLLARIILLEQGGGSGYNDAPLIQRIQILETFKNSILAGLIF